MESSARSEGTTVGRQRCSFLGCVSNVVDGNGRVGWGAHIMRLEQWACFDASG